MKIEDLEAVWNYFYSRDFQSFAACAKSLQCTREASLEPLVTNILRGIEAFNQGVIWHAPLTDLWNVADKIRKTTISIMMVANILMNKALDGK